MIQYESGNRWLLVSLAGLHYLFMWLRLEFFIACQVFLLINPLQAQQAYGPALIHKTIKKVTDVIVYDVFSPPVASRTYAYVSIAGYETIASLESNPYSFSGKLNGLSALSVEIPAEKIVPELVAAQAMLLVAKAMVVSEDSIEVFRLSLLDEAKKNGVSNKQLHAIKQYSSAIAGHILAWAAKDNYKETRSFPRHMLSMEEGAWKPTPPAYMKAVEPHWNRMRPFLLDSAQQFKPATAIPFSTEKDSRFFKDVQEVWEKSRQLTEEEKEIANFWDCNPFKLNQNGHVMTTNKKISPGGHWVNITALACTKNNTGSLESLKAYSLVAVVLADAFISCWDEKYRSLVIRPETYINQYMDPSWMPLLQTPPFPEYPSGHSVVSAAASVVLTRLFGNNFQYQDNTEVEFGLPVRTYASFEAAANEAAISRLYGGIHFRPAIENGLKEGRDLAGFALKKMQVQGAGNQD